MKTHKRVVEVEMEVMQIRGRHLMWRYRVGAIGVTVGAGSAPTEEAAWASAVRCAESLGPLATPEVTP